MNDVKLGIIQIDGLKELEQRLAMLPAQIERKILIEAVKKGAQVIQKSAREKAPKSTAPHLLKSSRRQYASWILPGNLKRNIRVKIDRSKTRGYAVTYEVYVKNHVAWYWKFQELGTSRHSAANGGTGFMRPAFEEMKYKAISEIEEQIRIRLDPSYLFE